MLIKLIIPFGTENSLNVSDIYQKLYIQNSTNEKPENVRINYLEQPKNIDVEDSIAISSVRPSNNINSNPYINIHAKMIFLSLWIMGAMVFIWNISLSNRKLKKVIGASIKNVQITHQNILYNCMKVMKVKTKVELLYSKKISSPYLYGLIRPKMLIPISVAENINDEELKYIIMHELIHLKKKDIFINWVISLLSVIYWFNPVVLYGFSKMRKDCEVSCDNKVISYLDEGENIQYGNVMIKVLELCGCSNRLMGTTSMVKNSLEIKRRIIMISKYKKINIKGILLGAIVIAIIGGLGIKINASKINIVNAKSIEEKSSISTSKDITPNSKKNITSYNTNSKVPFSSAIVIYNSHPDEDYISGINVTDVGALINDKLIKEGIKSNFLKCTVPKNYNEAYQNSRNLITTNVKDISKTVLLDIHRDITENSNCDTRKMKFTITKNNPYYKDGKKLAEILSQDINKSNKVKTEIVSYNHGLLCFNQDLSKNSMLIEIGNNMSSNSDIEACVNTLVSALKNIQGSLSH